MKKTKLLFAFLFFSQVIFALNIENIVISPLSNNAVNVCVKTINGNSFYYNNHNYNIANNILTVNVCYFIDVFPAGWSEENNFIIPFDTVTNSNYTIVVNVFLNNFQTSLCDFTNFQDT